jgi:hypothetical protein
MKVKAMKITAKKEKNLSSKAMPTHTLGKAKEARAKVDWNKDLSR